MLVVAVAIALDVSLPNKLRLGPRWLLPGLEALLLVGLVAASPSRRARHHKRRRAIVAHADRARQRDQCRVARAARPLPRIGRPRDRQGPDLLGRSAVGQQRAPVRPVVLGARPRWAGRADAAYTRRRPTSCSSQMSSPELAPKGWVPSLVDYLYLSFTQLDGVQPDGHDAADLDGQVADGRAVAGCADHGRIGRCSRREHSRRDAGTVSAMAHSRQAPARRAPASAQAPSDRLGADRLRLEGPPPGRRRRR